VNIFIQVLLVLIAFYIAFQVKAMRSRQNESNSMGTQENTVRKRWLKSLIAFFTYKFILNSLISLAALEEGAVSSISNTYSTLVCLSLGYSFAQSGICSWIAYYCAYRKRGTAWLAWTLWVIPIFALVTYLPDLQNLLFPLSTNEAIVTTLIVVIDLSISGWYWINCLRLRALNKAYQATLNEVALSQNDPVS
jgi:hypothetical protein